MPTNGPEPLQVATATSRAVAAGEHLRDRLATLRDAHAPKFADAYRRSTLGRIRAAYLGSSLHRLSTWGYHGIRQSWLYRWLTKEPDPDVIVIDLRETWTVGPPIAELERIFVPFERAIPSATSATLAHRAAKHPVPLASAALLGILLASLVQAWPANPLVLAAYAIGFVAAALGLAVEDSRTALANSRVATLLVAVLKPPEEETLPDGEIE